MSSILILLAILVFLGAIAWATGPSDTAKPVAPEGASVLSLINRLKADTRIKVLAEYPDRVSIEMSKALLEKTSIIKEYLRAEQPGAEHAAFMVKSVDQTHGPLYWPLVFASKDEPPKYFMADGEQRLKNVGEDGLFVAFVKDWASIEDAMKDAVSANAARTPPNETDVLAILASGKLTVKEAADRTGMEETKVSRLAKLAAHRWIWDIVRKNVIGYVMAGKLFDACSSNPDKLAALQNSLEEEYKNAEAEAKHWTDVINRNPSAKYDAKAKARRHIPYYFKGKDWSTWEDALEAGRIEQRDGKWFITLQKEAAKKVQGVWIGNDKDWEETIALYGLFGSKVEEIDTDDLKKYLEPGGYSDQVRDRIEAHLKRRLKVEAAAEHPMPRSNPVAEVTAPEEPASQQTGFDVDN